MACFLSAMVSCSLEETSYTQVDMNSYMNDASEAETVLLGVYSDLGTDGVYKYNLSFYFDLPNDQARAEGNSLTGTRMIPANAYTSTQSEIQTTWQALYKGIYDANLFIESISEKMAAYSDSDKAKAEYYIAEARAIRGLLYFELVRWYGHVPLMTSSSQSYLAASELPQADPVNVYEFIEEDLKAAADVLPYAKQDKVRSSNSYRFSKGAVLGLLAKVYATWAGYPIQDTSKWAEASKAAGEVVKSGQHSLLPDFETLWTNTANNIWDSRESLIEISFYSANSTTTSSGRIGKWNGVTAPNGSIRGNQNLALYRCIPTYLADWTGYQRDKRWALSFADYKYTTSGKAALMTYTDDSGKTVDGTFDMACAEDAKSSYRKAYDNTICPKKWDIELYVEDANQVQDNNYSNVNWYVLRYSDVLLLYAEALNESEGSPDKDAYDAINQVRRRGYGFPTGKSSYVADLSGLDQEEFRQAVRDERGHELVYEGQRRQDLVRWGIYPETVAKTYEELMMWEESAADYYQAANYTKKDKNELLPIPQREVDLCGYTQNVGW